MTVHAVAQGLLTVMTVMTALLTGMTLGSIG